MVRQFYVEVSFSTCLANHPVCFAAQFQSEFNFDRIWLYLFRNVVKRRMKSSSHRLDCLRSIVPLGRDCLCESGWLLPWQHVDFDSNTVSVYHHHGIHVSFPLAGVWPAL